MRAGTRHQHAAGIEQPQRALVDFLVSSRGSFDRLPRLREGRRIEHDRVELPLRSGVAGQDVEDIGLPKGDVADAVEVAIRLSRSDCMLGAVDAFDVLARSSQDGGQSRRSK